jgi:hypothetical protein
LKGRRDRPGLRAHRGPRAQKGTRDRLDLPVRRGPKEPKATRVRPRLRVCIRSGWTRALTIPAI